MRRTLIPSGGPVSRWTRTFGISRRAILSQHRLRARVAAPWARKALGSVHTVTLMIGHADSEDRLLGSLLDSHPAMRFAHGFDVLDHVAAGFDRRPLLHLLSRAAPAAAPARFDGGPGIDEADVHDETAVGTDTAESVAASGEARERDGDREPDEDTAESISAPDPAGSGRVRVPLQVLGESKAEATLSQLRVAPQLLSEFERCVEPVAVKILQLVRNPFDSIAAIAHRSALATADAADLYFDACAAIDAIHDRLGDEQVRLVRHEDLVADPAAEVASLCGWLEVDSPKAYLDAVVAATPRRPVRNRDQMEWTKDDVRTVEDRISAHPYLEGFFFDATLRMADGTRDKTKARFRVPKAKPAGLEPRRAPEPLEEMPDLEDEQPRRTSPSRFGPKPQEEREETPTRFGRRPQSVPAEPRHEPATDETPDEDETPTDETPDDDETATDETPGEDETPAEATPAEATRDESAPRPRPAPARESPSQPRWPKPEPSGARATANNSTRKRAGGNAEKKSKSKKKANRSANKSNQSRSRSEPKAAQ